MPNEPDLNELYERVLPMLGIGRREIPEREKIVAILKICDEENFFTVLKLACRKFICPACLRNKK
jgi:hypothetical protein